MLVDRLVVCEPGTAYAYPAPESSGGLSRCFNVKTVDRRNIKDAKTGAWKIASNFRGNDRYRSNLNVLYEVYKKQYSNLYLEYSSD